MKEEDHGAVLCRCAPERLPWDMTLNHPATVVRRAWFDRLGGFDERLSNAMDYDFFLRARLAGARFRVVPAALVAMAGGGQSERSLWRTLRETHDIRRRHLATGLGRSPAWLAYLWTKGSTRVALQRLGLDGLVRWWRRTLAYPPKGD
jgi:GT2 family glycosyltransferase